MAIDTLEQRGTENAPEDLERLWSNQRTFVYVSSRIADRSWLTSAISAIPETLATDHFCLMTSGTTGKPKLVVASRRRAETLCRMLHEKQELEPVLETVVALPLTYCYAFVNQWLWSRVFGRRLVVTSGLADTQGLGVALSRAQDAMLCLVGPQAALLVDAFSGRVFHGVIRLNFAGGPFPVEHLGALRALFPNARIFNNYGCAEAMPRLCVTEVDDGADAADIGYPLPGVRLRISTSGVLEFLSEFGCVAEVNGSGFRSIGPSDWTSTGDLGSQDPAGRWRVQGRIGEVFKRYGEKIAVPQLLSSAKRVWPGQLGYYRDRDSAGEDGYVLVLSPTPGIHELQQILQSFRENHPRTHWPLRIESTGALATSENGKIGPREVAAQPDRTLNWRQRI